ncbi:hypothetical protein PITC_010350 [Penicillium italicum]|uniref:DUF7587 domain-containing protein n=1 Tax=Penicillium italicum TaxID=40296 RepID=A0A0A2LN58_PENIT|nr:hypothetical protein PITC_010350 [Penicillium italicum]
MDQYCLSRTQIPERLYRVQHDKSFTQDIEAGLAASDEQTFTEDTDEFALAVEYHINDCIVESGTPFISTFASKAQAEDWMCRKWRSYGEGAQILEIETSRLGHGYVYRAGEVAHTLEVDVSQTTYQDLHNEYLILHSVPARAIIARRARMVTHDLENSNPGSNSSNATTSDRLSPVSTEQSPWQSGTRERATFYKSPPRLQVQPRHPTTPRGSRSAKASSTEPFSSDSPFNG